MIMLNQIFIGTVLSAITTGAAYRHHQWRKYHIIDNHKEIDRKYAGSDILSISAKIVKRIDKHGFKNCRSLEEANFPKANSIGDCAFMYCRLLKEANFPELVSIGAASFEECIQLKEANFPKANSIGDCAFMYCRLLKEANFPEATSIGDYGFRECFSLKKVNFAELVSIGAGAFMHCSSLEEANFPKLVRIGTGAFRKCTSLKEANFPELMSIGNYGFKDCTSLEEANFPELTSIGVATFIGCTSLKKSNFPEATSIGDYGFKDCTSLEEANFPKANSIGDRAFMYCRLLKEANFPELVSIGTASFEDCTSLKVGYFPKATSIDHSAFSSCDSLQIIILPDSLFDNNVVTDEWKEQRGIRADAQCIRHSDYLQSIEEINNLIGQKRFKEGDDKILELQLLQKIHDDEKALPGKLSDDEKRTLNGSCASDVYKIVSSIKGDDYERKKEWAKFLGVKVEMSEPMTENSGEAEDTTKTTLVRQQLDTIALDIELDKMITKCEGPIHEYLSLKEMMSLKQTSRESDMGLRCQFNSERTERENTLNEYKKQLDAYIQNPNSSEKELDSMANQVETLFKEVTQSDSRSRKPKT